MFIRGLLQPDVEFVWWWGGVCKVLFMSNPTAVLRLRLCCVVIGEVAILFLVGEPELNIWLCVVCGVCVCGVPWMDAMLRVVREERQLYSHNQCVKYTCTHSRGHKIDMNRAGIFAWAPALHGHSKFLSQVFQLEFWCCEKQIWLTTMLWPYMANLCQMLAKYEWSMQVFTQRYIAMKMYGYSWPSYVAWDTKLC